MTHALYQSAARESSLRPLPYRHSRASLCSRPQHSSLTLHQLRALISRRARRRRSAPVAPALAASRAEARDPVAPRRSPRTSSGSAAPVAEARPRRGEHLQAARRRHARGERRLGRRLDRRPVGERVRERDADLDRGRSRLDGRGGLLRQARRRPSGRSPARACGASLAAPCEHGVDVLVAAAREADHDVDRPAPSSRASCSAA